MNRMLHKRFFYGMVVLLFVFLTIPSTVYSSKVSAVGSASCDEAFYSGNDILFYDPCAASCSTGQVSVGTTLKIEETDTIKTIYTYLTSTPLSTNSNKPLTPAQAAGVMGNFYAESSFNPSAIEDTSRAQKGHGLAQWTFGRWTNLSNFATQQGKPWDDVNVQLDFLKTELEGSEKAVFSDSEFATTDDPSSAAMRWRVVFERADPTVAHDDKRQGAAVAIYNMFGGSSSVCQSSTAVIQGDFVETAINFALTSPATDGLVSKTQARDTYQTAKEEFNPSVDWTDCGGYIATALYASGVDKNYPNVSVAAQLAYVKGSTEKYSINQQPVMSDLQPGDILYVSGHTTLYTGDAQYPMVDASLGQRVPSVRPLSALQWMLSQSDITSARIVK